jgi:hypothetical protein
MINPNILRVFVTQCWRGLQAKLVLTYVVSRMDACQGGLRIYFATQKSTALRPVAIVTTNFGA